MNNQFSLTKKDAMSLFRGLGISVLAVVLGYITTNLIPELEASALTPQAAAAVAIASNTLNFLQRFLRNT